MLHDEAARLFLNCQMAIIGAADGDAVVAGRRLNPDIVVAGLAHDLSVGHAVQPHAAGDAEILGASRLPQPDGAFDQDLLGVVLHLPGNIAPMLHGGGVLPLFGIVGLIRLIELLRPIADVQLPVLERGQGLHPSGASIRRQAHDLAAFVPIGEDIARHAAIRGAETLHIEELIAQQTTNRVQPDFLHRLEVRAFEPVVTLGFARQRIDTDPSADPSR